MSSSHSANNATVSSSATSAANPTTAQSSTISFPTQSPSPSASGGGGGGGNFQSSALYLYTFLATLIVLFGISSAVVARSFVLRRRHRRMMAEAIANGTWIPPAPRVNVDLHKTPRLWDTWVQPPLMNVHGEKHDWDGLMPFAASYSPLSNAPSPSPSLAPSTFPSAGPQPRVRVAVLIAMPAPEMFPASDSAPNLTAPRTHGANVSAPDELPHLEVGVASVGIVAAHKVEEEDGDGDGAAHYSEGEEEEAGGGSRM
ncbi:hypothetical protein K438DRAFT_1780860 [Mycena galopus ATCC 62051]|nr:hypothetical protein K438DRAFT_1780860 [Mycena galopus ATCC 62051]